MITLVGWNWFIAIFVLLFLQNNKIDGLQINGHLSIYI